MFTRLLTRSFCGRGKPGLRGSRGCTWPFGGFRQGIVLVWTRRPTASHILPSTDPLSLHAPSKQSSNRTRNSSRELIGQDLCRARRRNYRLVECNTEANAAANDHRLPHSHPADGDVQAACPGTHEKEWGEFRADLGLLPVPESVLEVRGAPRNGRSHGIAVMSHPGTSVFPGARNRYGDPIYVDDVAVDFPMLKILLAHGGRPLWMKTAFFLIRRHPNVYLDISGIPPKTLLQYFPRLEEIASKTLFGTDWPGPGVPDIKRNLDDFRSLPLTDAVKDQILSRTALEIWPK